MENNNCIVPNKSQGDVSTKEAKDINALKELKGVSTERERVTGIEYQKLVQAFDYFNKKLFTGKLPDVFFTICRHRGAAGYFRPEGFQERIVTDSGEVKAPGFFVHEIALMPDAMYGRHDREVLSTLVHEMCHLEQEDFGKPARKGYHNGAFAKMMKAAGLQTSNYGALDSRNPYRKKTGVEAIDNNKDMIGAETGQRMSHYIIKDGVFDVACNELLASGFSFKLHAVPNVSTKAPKSKFKYTCPSCLKRAWAKKDMNLMCGDCKENMKMESENDSEN